MEAPGCKRTLLRGSEVEIFQLVSEGASREQWAQWLRVPLEHAAAEGNLDLVTTLLGAGADGGVGWRGLHGRTLLAAAVQGGNEEVVQALLKAGATAEMDVQFGDDFRTALHVAAAEGAEAVAKSLLLAGADPKVMDKFGHGAHHVAAEKGHHRMICDLVQHGALVNSRNARGNSVLIEAAKHGNLELVNLLLRHGANVSEVDREGWTVLHYVCLFSDEEHDYAGVVRALLEAGAPVNARTDSEENAPDGSTALHFAAEMGVPGGTLLALLQGGANVNCQNYRGQTPLHRACVESNIAGAELLLRWGADETTTDYGGRTAADLTTPHHEANGDTLRRMMARAPAFRAWRRRGWLVVQRYYRNRPRLTPYDSSSPEVDGEATNSSSCATCSPAVTRSAVDTEGMAGGGGGVAREEGAAPEGMVGWQSLVARVVGLDVEDVFRTVVFFL